jgi:hypothetical protein
MARVLTGRRQQLYSGRKAAETNETLLGTAGTTSLNTRDTEVAKEVADCCRLCFGAQLSNDSIMTVVRSAMKADSGICTAREAAI